MDVYGFISSIIMEKIVSCKQILLSIMNTRLNVRFFVKILLKQVGKCKFPNYNRKCKEKHS